MSHPPSEPEPLIHTGVCDGPVPWREWDASALRDCGAEAAFIGRTRAQIHPQWGSLLRLDYEAYQPMVERLLHRLALDAVAAHGCRAVRLMHAMGPVPVGQASVVIQVAAPHRAPALAACSELIERVKHELPVWKHEIWERSHTLVEGSPVMVNPRTEHPADPGGRVAETPT